MTYNLGLFRMPKAWGHAFPEGGVYDNYSNSGKFQDHYIFEY